MNGWVVVVDNGDGPAQALYAHQRRGRRPVPFDRAAALRLANYLNDFPQTQGRATALPLTTTPQTGV